MWQHPFKRVQVSLRGVAIPSFLLGGGSYKQRGEKRGMNDRHSSTSIPGRRWTISLFLSSSSAPPAPPLSLLRPVGDGGRSPLFAANYRLLGVGSQPGHSGPHGSQFSRQTLPSTIRPLRKVAAAPERLPDRLLTAGGS